MDFLRVDHLHVKAHLLTAVSQVLKFLKMRVRLAEPQVPFLRILSLDAKLFRKMRPELLNRAHRDRQFTDIAA